MRQRLNVMIPVPRVAMRQRLNVMIPVPRAAVRGTMRLLGETLTKLMF